MSKVSTIVYNPKLVFLIIRIASWVIFLPLLKRLIPLHRIVNLMLIGTKKNSLFAIKERDLLRIVQKIYATSETRCLERSLLLYRYLSFCQNKPELVVGLRKEKDQWIGHAWVLLNEEAIAENKLYLKELKPIFKFTYEGKLQKL